MKKNPRMLLIVGVICLLIGGYLYMQNNDDSVNQKNLEIAMNATNAQDAARQISANNQSEIGGNALAMGLLGFGSVLTLFSIVGLVKKKTVVG